MLLPDVLRIDGINLTYQVPPCFNIVTTANSRGYVRAIGFGFWVWFFVMVFQSPVTVVRLAVVIHICTIILNLLQCKDRCACGDWRTFSSPQKYCKCSLVFSELCS